jgi:long-chain fatty acid transport protein
MRRKFSLGVALIAVAGLASPAFSAGFALIEQGVSGLGNSYAGAAAVAEDATTIYFNPAGLTRLKGQQAVAGLHMVAPQAEFENKGSTKVTGAPLTGGNGGDGGETGYVPNVYYSANLNNGFSVGLGINAPFGLTTEYDEGWVGRYHALKSELITVNINPTLAYKVNDTISVGAGVSAQYLEAELTNAVDFGLVLFNQTGNPAVLATPDGAVKLEGDSWAYGFNLGMLFEIDENSRIGFAYRTRMQHEVEGTATFTGVPVALQGVFSNTNVVAHTSLPDSASASFYSRFAPKWALLGDLTWTHWQRFKELRFDFANSLPDGVTTENWLDTWRGALGLNYHPTDRIVVRTGLAYDQSAVASSAFRTPRIPDGDRKWVSLGLGYQFTDRVGMDLGYAHLFVNDPSIDKTATGEDASRGALKGTFDSSVDIASAQLVVKF